MHESKEKLWVAIATQVACPFWMSKIQLRDSHYCLEEVTGSEQTSHKSTSASYNHNS